MSVRSARHVAQGLWLSLALVAGLALAQAPTPDQAGSAHAPGIYAHSEQDWTLVEINGRPLPEGARPPTLRIDGEHIAGFGGCNRYMGPIREMAPGEVAIGPLAGTMILDSSVAPRKKREKYCSCNLLRPPFATAPQFRLGVGEGSRKPFRHSQITTTAPLYRGI